MSHSIALSAVDLCDQFALSFLFNEKSRIPSQSTRRKTRGVRTGVGIKLETIDGRSRLLHQA